MAFTLTAYLGSSSLTLTSTPYSLLRAVGMGGANVRRVTTQGPAQDGDTDKGYRLLPRDIELVIGVKAATDTLLDSYRDALIAIFKPVPSTPVKLRYTRDDGAVRQIDCYLRDRIRIDLVPGYRPGHYHQVTVPLRAADPAWYALAPGTASIVGPTTFTDNWWLAGGAIDASSVLMHGGTPGLDEAWSYAGTRSASQEFVIAIRAAYVDSAGTTAYMFRPTSGTVNAPSFYRQTDTDGLDAGIPRYRFNNFDTSKNAGIGMIAGTQNYFYVHRPVNGGVSWRRSTQNYAFAAGNWALVGTTMRWRTSGWSGAIQFYALYDRELTVAQYYALDAYMGGTAGSVSQAVALPYVGDLPEYPVISVTGPITSPVITNTTTGETLSFGTISIGAGTTYVIDTRYGYKTVLEGTVDRRPKLSADSDLGTWHLAPAPAALGGTNVITLGGSGAGSATTLSVVYYDRFASF